MVKIKLPPSYAWIETRLRGAFATVRTNAPWWRHIALIEAYYDLHGCTVRLCNAS